jgi:hypothetical protein
MENIYNNFLTLIKCFMCYETRMGKLDGYQLIIIIIIIPSQSTAGHRPLQVLAISLDPRPLASSSCQPSCASRYSTWPQGVLNYVYLDAASTPELIYPSGYRFYGCYDQPNATSAC